MIIEVILDYGGDKLDNLNNTQATFFNYLKHLSNSNTHFNFYAFFQSISLNKVTLKKTITNKILRRIQRLLQLPYNLINRSRKHLQLWRRRCQNRQQF